MDIGNISKAKVLAALFNASKPLGMGMIHFDPAPMSEEDAQQILDSGMTDFDYLQGRVMKVDLSGDTLDTWGYNRDNGPDAAENAINAISDKGVNSPKQKTRSEHLDWCKQRALACVDDNDLHNAFISMVSDLKKHPDTADHIAIELGMLLLATGKLNTQSEMRSFIKGFN